MNIMQKPTTFGLIVGTRGFFNPGLAAQGRADLIAKLDELGYNYVIPSEEDTPNGSVETLADARLYADFFKKHADEIDGIVVVLPNFGDELGIVNTLNLAKLDVPVLVQACADDLDKLDVQNRRDAWCGKLSVCANLYQYGIPFTDTSAHVMKIDSDAFTADLDYFARVCRVVKGLRSARIGSIGARPAPFHTCRFSEKLFQDSGVTVVTVDLSEIIAAAEALADDDDAVQQTLTESREYGVIPDHIADAQVMKSAKLTVAVRAWMAENECDASAIQCWTSIQENYGCATCLTMSMMGEFDLKPSACEVDVAGAVAMYALLLASGNPPALQDWNNNYGDEEDKCINVHCSNFPKSFMSSEIEISELDVLGETLGREFCFGAVKGKVAPGPMTYFRISTDDRRGVIKTYVGEGEFTDDPNPIQGGSAVCHVPNLRELMGYICKNGFEHHVALTRERVADVIDEAVSNYLGWEVYHHNK